MHSISDQETNSFGCVIDRATGLPYVRVNPTCYQPWPFGDEGPLVFCSSDGRVAVDMLFGVYPLNGAARSNPDESWVPPETLGLNQAIVDDLIAMGEELCV